MVRRILRKTYPQLAQHYRQAKSILFADPKLLYEEDRELIKRPFYFPGDSGKAVLLLHGWSTTPYEIRRLGMFLNESGYTVYAPMLSGHGTKPSDLESVVYQDWISDAQGALDELKKSYDQVYVGGTSMGANLTMQIAKKNRDIAGLILMATPYRLKFEELAKFIVMIMGKFKKYHKKFYPPTFGASTTITRLISYQEYPIQNALELEKLVRLSRKNLDKITQPCLILQSAHDHIVTRGSLKKIYYKIGSKIKRKKYIQKAYHTFISDIKNEHVFEDILNFLDEN